MKTGLSYLKSLAGDLFHVLFPDLCLCCQRMPKAKQASFCVACLHGMPYTDHFIIRDNEVTNLFRGRIGILFGAALLRFREGNMVQQMLHQLKYKKQREIAEVFGTIAGQKMIDSSLFIRPDLIIPVPIHPEKEKRRGYNQSVIFGNAISRVIDVPCNDKILIKSKKTESQTGKTRAERILNVSDVFVLNHPDQIMGKHILMVDDVVTTGATLEACCIQLKTNGAKAVSILTLSAAS